MAEQGPTEAADTERVAASLLKLARRQSGLSQRALAAAAGVPHSTVARIESGTMQPTLPLLYRILAAAGLEPRIDLEAYDDPAALPPLPPEPPRQPQPMDADFHAELARTWCRPHR